MDGSVTAPEDLNAQVTTAKLTGAVESTLQLQRLEQKHAGTWLCADGLLRPAGVSRSVEVTVLSLSTPTCPSQVTQSNKGRYAWPRTMAGLRIHLPCQASSSTNSGGGQASQQASRSCDAGGSWSDPPDVASCPYLSEVTKVLEQFARTNLTFSKTSALESARRFKSYLADADPLQDPQDAWFATETLEHYLDSSGRHTELLPVVMDVLALLVRQPVELLADCRHRLLSMLQQAPLKTPEPFQYEAGTLVVSKQVVHTPPPSALAAQTCLWSLPSAKTPVPTPEAAPLPVGVPLTPPKTAKSAQIECWTFSDPSEQSVATEARVRIPLSNSAMARDPQTMIVSLLTDSNMFVDSGKSGLRLVTSVVGVAPGQSGGGVMNRSAAVLVTVRVRRVIAAGERLVGARWNTYTDQWLTEQCAPAAPSAALPPPSPQQQQPELFTFQCCCGSGYFGALVAPASSAADVAAPVEDTVVGVAASPGRVWSTLLVLLLPAPVYVGSVVCVACHAACIASYALHEAQLRVSRPTKHALVNTWLSIGLLVSAFSVGIKPLFGRLPCQIVGLVIHYLTLR